MKKYLLIMAFILGVTQAVFAGQMKKDSKGSYYVKDNGKCASSEWVTFDSDSDGKEEYYYFDSRGYLTTSGKTADGYEVNSKGQWIKDGKVQVKEKSTNKNDSQSKINDTTDALKDAYNKGLDAGQKAVEAGMDIGVKAVEDAVDVVDKMYGGIFKDEVNELKDIYKDAAKDLKKEYGDIMNDYKKEMNNYMKDYSSQLGDIFSGLGF